MDADKRGCYLVAKNTMSDNLMAPKYLTATGAPMLEIVGEYKNEYNIRK